MHSAGRVNVALSRRLVDCPFLYQTRTILGSNQGHHHTRSLTGSEHHRRDKSNPTASTTEQKGTSFLKQKAAKTDGKKPQLGSSITPAEQAAFDSILALFKKPAPSTPKARATSTDHTDTDYKNILELFSSIPKSSHVVNQDTPGNTSTTRDDATQTNASSSHEDIGRTSAIPKHQPSTQARSRLSRESAMAEIKGFLKDTSTSIPALSSSTSSSASKTTDRIQSTALSIVEDAADSLTTALSSQSPRPDIAMWQVAEEKIFPLISLLRPTPSPLSTPLPTKSSTAPPSDETTTLPPHNHSLIPSDLPLLPLLSLTYPSLTLLILRLYATHQSISPYALALLPTLKSLGPTSYVLGAHTHFYNTLLSLYWRMYSNLRGMNTLLTEMDVNGVEFDVGTWEAIKMIGEDRQKDMDGDGERGEDWWYRNEQRVWWVRVGEEWRDIIRRRLEEKGLLAGEVRREDFVHREVDTDGEKPDYVVTL